MNGENQQVEALIEANNRIVDAKCDPSSFMELQKQIEHYSAHLNIAPYLEDCRDQQFVLCKGTLDKSIDEVWNNLSPDES